MKFPECLAIAARSPANGTRTPWCRPSIRKGPLPCQNDGERAEPCPARPPSTAGRERGVRTRRCAVRRRTDRRRRQAGAHFPRLLAKLAPWSATRSYGAFPCPRRTSVGPAGRVYPPVVCDSPSGRRTGPTSASASRMSRSAGRPSPSSTASKARTKAVTACCRRARTARRRENGHGRTKARAVRHPSPVGRVGHDVAG